MVNIATVAYIDRPIDTLPTMGAWADTQEPLIAAYVERRLSQLALDSRYSAAQTTQYLSWLAWQMQRHHQTVFSIEWMQPAWLLHQQRRVLMLAVRLVFAQFGDAWLRHYLICLLLVRQGVMPVRYVHFLDVADQRILLRKVDGGYIFIHRMLLEHFAVQYTGPEITERNTISNGTYGVPNAHCRQSHENVTV